ncbi:bifunctional phosphopantothenoylcysteine decarboxylase/phosphopantothenate--cysteine ligase CoaBC [Marinicellulosiphila megalodicopiae]|uniref:bifunctional phosphopantothenoylcysteine decarboxylase/phosphopantothenate--cysteine ligase CoaBC n=1 Tax=Marinicellulosiphila megalodicopiae TaxID=2724896 RepID=UPI003BB03A72
MRIILAITGGIAAYKSAVLARLLVKQGHDVRVIMTQNACEFISPLTLQALTGKEVHTTLLDEQAEKGMGHIELAKWAEVILIAPATANCIATLNAGLAPELLYAVILASRAKLWVAPAMNELMWQNPVVQHNLSQLRKMYAHRWHTIGPDSGEQACGDVGLGRMSEPETIAQFVLDQLDDKPADALFLQSKHVVITAGPTEELIDPVRFISNKSSGKMGYALAEAASKMGAKVTLISGPVNIEAPKNIQLVKVQSAKQMLQQVMNIINECDIFISCAAVADYACSQVSEHKLKKQNDQPILTLELIKNPDILATVGKLPSKPFCVGFAAETQNVEQYARTKLVQKNIDWIVANDVSKEGIGFNSDDNQVTLISHDKTMKLKKMTKQKLAYTILETVCAVN